MELPSTKPYLIRAIHQWCCDNGFTPYLAVAVDARTRVPPEHVRDGQIVLNIGYEATAHLSLSNEGISFQARFGGMAREIAIPVGNVAAIYARENGAGMAFEPELAAPEEAAADGCADYLPAADEPDPTTPSPTAGRPRLQRVK
ncbi:MAG: ClpXP protease specificity-enhancing factor [Candidatus Accumulibacter sp.]|uniref:ClpXP protease specificity-enhancing factor n=1 Tax=Accumulibacter sp. TaxID=2053492 RepID=UPI00287A65CC|nr:ClpXP protease specificity-enhancing factor [Accumulibacter sp.]MDS4016170.1 ClpXP protease specificity-enhancing factor [Accumulibacter sp.]